MSDDAVFAKWDKWLSTIYDDVQQLLVNRHIVREVQEIIRSNPSIQSDDTFYGTMWLCYATTAVIGIRRQLDTDMDSVSFARLLSEIQNRAEVLSRQRYVALYLGSTVGTDYADEEFDKFAGARGPHVDPAGVGNDLLTLNQKGQKVREFTNKRIAHHDKAEFKNIPTFAEVDECLDYLESLLTKYVALFRAEVLMQVVPDWQYDWKEVFRRPWIDRA